MTLGETGRGNQGDDTAVKLEVSVEGAGAAPFGMAADVNCDLSVALTRCQQTLPLLEGSPSAAICSLQQRGKSAAVSNRSPTAGDAPSFTVTFITKTLGILAGLPVGVHANSTFRLTVTLLSAA